MINFMVCGGITKDGTSKSKADPCGVCYLRVKANTVFCLQCGRWIHGRCAGLKMVTSKSLKTLLAGNVNWRGSGARSYVMKWKQKESLHIISYQSLHI